MTTDLDKEIIHEVKIFRNFRIHLSIYFIVIACTWIGYWAAGGVMGLETWPVYVSLAWGLILVLHLIVAYRAFRKSKLQ